MSHETIVQPSRNGQPATDVVKMPDPEVVPKTERRRFSAEYKLRILAEADACTQRGEIGALLRREGRTARTWNKWREQTPCRCLCRPRRPEAGPQAAALSSITRWGK